MEKIDDFKRADERAGLMTKLSWIGSAGALLLLAVSSYLGSSRGGAVLSLAAVPFALALLFALAAVVYGILYGGAMREEEEKKLLAKRMESRALNVEEDVRFTAGRSFANYCRFAPFVLAVLAAALTGTMLWFIRADWQLRAADAGMVMAGNPVHTALIAAVMMMVSVFAGAFFVGQSRMPGFRWLRPVGAWLLAGFLILLTAAISAVFYGSNIPQVDAVSSKVVFWILAVLGCEFAVNFIIEFYRPRSLGESRPVFESQLLSLFTEPGGVLRNIASALDYQFGFKVSGTWIYSFIERSFFPVLILWAVLLWGFTCIHEVGPNRVGIKERFGKIASGVLDSGVYWTLPYPFGGMRTFSCTEVKRIIVGESVESAKERSASSVVLWTNNHGAKEPFLVAVAGDRGKAAAGEASMSFVNMAIPIEYTIRRDGILKYAYENTSPVKTLNKIGEQAVVEYLSGASMDALMASGRHDAEVKLRKRIQELADRDELGIEIIRVGIMDAHPPVEKVAPAYQNVIGALEEKETEILKAQAYEATIIPETRAAADEIVAKAESSAEKKRMIAAAESDRFKQQLRAFLAMPAMFRLNAQMELLENDARDIRKYIVSSTLTDEVYQLNFETRDRLDLVDIDTAELSNDTAKK
ncbi:MAG: hypothetical protein IKA71_00215 [Lentisphaeria bacterium]|nr:hypothetical protein [Lentisphaeria bacterium]